MPFVYADHRPVELPFAVSPTSMASALEAQALRAVRASPQATRLILHLKAFDTVLLARAVRQTELLVGAAHTETLHTRYLSARTKKWTILRSPHVNKTSREQFQKTTHTCILSLSCTPRMASLFLSVLASMKVPGVGVRVTTEEYRTALPGSTQHQRFL